MEGKGNFSMNTSQNKYLALWELAYKLLYVSLILENIAQLTIYPIESPQMHLLWLLHTLRQV